MKIPTLATLALLAWLPASLAAQYPPVTDFRMTDRTATHVTFDWTYPIVVGDQSTTIIYYSTTPITAYSEELPPDVEMVIATGTTTPQAFEFGPPPWDYYFTIRYCKDDSGALSPNSNVIRESMEIDTVNPNRVTDLEVLPRSHSSVTLRWTDPYDDAGSPNSGPVEFRDIKGSPIDPGSPSNHAAWFNLTAQPVGGEHPSLTEPGPGSRVSMTVIGLSPGTMYHFAVRGVDNAINPGEVSNIVSLRTPEPPPDLDESVDQGCGLMGLAGTTLPMLLLAMLGLARSR